MFLYFEFFFLQRLANSLCEILNIPSPHCLAAVNELQINAIDKLKARDDFQKTGKTFILLKFGRFHPYKHEKMKPTDV